MHIELFYHATKPHCCIFTAQHCIVLPQLYSLALYELSLNHLFHELIPVASQAAIAILAFVLLWTSRPDPDSGLLYKTLSYSKMIVCCLPDSR